MGRLECSFYLRRSSNGTHCTLLFYLGHIRVHGGEYGTIKHLKYIRCEGQHGRLFY